MRTSLHRAAGLFMAIVVNTASAAVRYVDLNSPNPSPPYDLWHNAATNIQDAIDRAVAGDVVMVTNGVYATGGRAVFGNMTNRVVVDKPLTLLSVNGPEFTAIVGRQHGPGMPNGDSAIRCVYLTNGASLSGFTLMDGATLSTGDDINGKLSGGGVWCESTNSFVTNCVLLGNNAAWQGGGAFQGTLYNCKVITNRSAGGGGTWFSVLNNCLVSDNASSGSGGGSAGGVLNNCLLYGNSAMVSGGGAWGGVLNNCTLAGNSASSACGGISVTGRVASVLAYIQFTLYNCIVYANSAPAAPNYEPSGTLNYCCTTPLPAAGVGNITADPMFVEFLTGNLRLQSNSPCINAGTNAYAAPGPDLDGNLRIIGVRVDMGAYEFPGNPGPVVPYILTQPSSQAVGVGSNATFTVTAGGDGPLAYWWRFNGMNLDFPSTNVLWVTNVQPTNAGNYSVVVSNAAGWVLSSNALLTVILIPQVIAGTHYVNLNSANPTPPYTNWGTASLTIQDAIDVAAGGDEIVVTNGVYATGGRAVYGSLTNRAAVDRPVTVRSVNGPGFTVIQGYQLPGTTNGDGAVRCVYLTNGASLSGFTLTGGATRDSGSFQENVGGGICCESTSAWISNCVITANSASWHASAVIYGTLNNCTIRSNTPARLTPGAVYESVLNECDLVGNIGGAAANATLLNCLIRSNNISPAVSWAGYSAVTWGRLTNCTLLANSALFSGGGASFATLVHCRFINNTGAAGGGAYRATLIDCLLTGNSARAGGGAAFSVLNNCTISGNWAGQGGGVCGEEATNGLLNNCIVYFNTATNGAVDGENYSGGIFNHCCTAPLPPQGSGNIDLDPLFVNLAAGDFHLQPGSPCVNAGLNASALSSTDLDGNPRIVGGIVDMGAYEFQDSVPTGFQAWLQFYGLPADGSADYLDSDGDGMNNWQEWRCRTNPTNQESVLRMVSATWTNDNIIVSWQSVAGVNYFLQRSTNPGTNASFSAIATNLPGQFGTNAPGQPGITSYTDTNASVSAQLFYRVGITSP
jgi:hypothetical protein